MHDNSTKAGPNYLLMGLELFPCLDTSKIAGQVGACYLGRIGTATKGNPNRPPSSTYADLVEAMKDCRIIGFVVAYHVVRDHYASDVALIRGNHTPFNKSTAGWPSSLESMEKLIGITAIRTLDDPIVVIFSDNSSLKMDHTGIVANSIPTAQTEDVPHEQYVQFATDLQNPLLNSFQDYCRNLCSRVTATLSEWGGTFTKWFHRPGGP